MIPTQVRTALRERTKGRCDLCGRLDRLDAHHRRQRSVGGKDVLSNLLGVCRRCHNRIHHSMKHSLNLGWLVQSWADPAGKPVRLYEGWVVLGDDGSTVIDEAPSL